MKQIYLRGWSDKYLAYKKKKKTKILEKWWFISQDSLLLARYTWPSNALTSLTHLKNTFLEVCKVGLCGGDNLLTQLKFLPGKWLFQVWKQKKVSQGQIWRIRWMGQHFVVRFDQFCRGDGRGMSWCIVMMEGHFFLRQMEPFFSAIWRQISPIIWHSRALWPFCPSPGSWCRSHLVNSRKRWS